MAKVLTPFDLSRFSRLVEYGTMPTLSIRDFGALEQNTTLSGLSSNGSKLTSQWDLSAATRMKDWITTSGVTTKDMRGNVTVSSGRAYGALEYDPTIPYINDAAKVLTIFDISNQSALINIVYELLVAPNENSYYLAVTKDARGTTVRSKTRIFNLQPPDVINTVKDMRQSTVKGSWREWGALEYDSTITTAGGLPRIIGG